MPNKLLHIMYSCALNCDLAHWLASWMDVGYKRMGVTRSWRIFISLADKFDWLFYSSGPYFLLKRIRSQQNFFLSKPCKLLRGLFVNFSLKISLRGRNFSGTSLPRYRENTFGPYTFEFYILVKTTLFRNSCKKSLKSSNIYYFLSIFYACQNIASDL